MSRNAVIIVGVILLVLAGGWFILNAQKSATPTPSPQVPATATPTEPSPTSATEEGQVKQENLVKISSAGFDAKNITIKVEESVSWTNADSADHTVNSAPHPLHTDYPPLNLGVIKPGESKSLSFPKAGTYRYHDHLNPSLFGSVTVE